MQWFKQITFLLNDSFSHTLKDTVPKSALAAHNVGVYIDSLVQAEYFGLISPNTKAYKMCW